MTTEPKDALDAAFERIFKQHHRLKELCFVQDDYGQYICKGYCEITIYKTFLGDLDVDIVLPNDKCIGIDCDRIVLGERVSVPTGSR